MTAIELSEDFRKRRAHYDILSTLVVGWRAMRRHRQERQLLVAISRLAPHVIRDIGLDPEQVYEALEGTWDEIDPANFRSKLPRRERI